MANSCCLYRDPFLYAAQFLAVVGVLLSLIGFYWTWISSMTSAILLASATCCSVGKVTFYIAILFAVGTAVGQVFVILDPTDFVEACLIGGDNDEGDEDENGNANDTDDEGCDENLYRGMGMFGLSVWVLVALFTLYFVWARHDQLMRKHQERQDPELQAGIRASLGHSSIVQGTSTRPAQPVPLQTTQSVTTLTDGSKQVETSTYMSDGSVQVQITMEPPPL